MDRRDARRPGEFLVREYAEKVYEPREYQVKDYAVKEYVAQIYVSYGINAVTDSEIRRVEHEFQRRTSIVNRTDLTFLTVATALMVMKGILFPMISENQGYAKPANMAQRLDHNDKSITSAHRSANDAYRDRHLEKNNTGKWINLIYQTPPYDITVGSSAIGRNMEGGYHRLHTLGHDPILGWVFGTANILTDTITYPDFVSYRVIRKPKMSITPEMVPIWEVFMECLDMIQTEPLCLPSAIFAEAQHLKSDIDTKLGLPIPVLETVNMDFAGNLYKEHYDQLCLTRDIGIIKNSAEISILINMIVGLTHGVFYDKAKDGSKDLYEARTRKILLYSNAIGTTSNIVSAIITQKPSSIDIGGLLVTISRLFSDIRFISKLKQEYLRTN